MQLFIAACFLRQKSPKDMYKLHKKVVTLKKSFASRRQHDTWRANSNLAPVFQSESDAKCTGKALRGSSFSRVSFFDLILSKISNQMEQQP